jgi:aspartyl aminopeptidase
VQLYGGGIWQSWFDRDLSVAGKVIVKDELTNKLSSRLIRISYPILRIPNLAIHLTTERNKFEWNNENHLKAIMSTTFFDGKVEDNNIGEEEKLVNKKLGSKLADLISRELNVQKKQIIDFDLCLYDTHESCFLGIDQEFVSSGRLDNLGSSLVSVYALINDTMNISKQSSINFIALFDNEEVGSLSFQGADSEFFGKNLERIFRTIQRSSEEQISSEDDFLACCARSFVLSADMAHAFHPNYSEKYQSDHRPFIHGGITIKINPQSRYSTDSEGSSILKQIAMKAKVPYQEFIVKQDSPCGTTIGPIIAGKLGIKTADIGIPQFAMHSIREMCGVCDLEYYRRFFEEFLKSYEDCVGDLIKY